MLNVLEHIKEKFPDFLKSEQFLQKLENSGTLMEVPKDTTIVNVGEYIKVIPFLLEGQIKIYREDDDGKEILLYYINSGESCVMSITTCLKNEKGSIKALVAEDSLLMAVPKDDFIKLLNEFNLLQVFTYDLFRSKYNELIKAIDNLAFNDTSSRIKQYLLRESEIKKTKNLKGLTHKQIAQDLATSREVVSRILHLLQREGFLSLDNRMISIN